MKGLLILLFSASVCLGQIIKPMWMPINAAGGGGTNPGVYATNSVEVLGTAKTTNTLTALPAGGTLVFCTASSSSADTVLFNTNSAAVFMRQVTNNSVASTGPFVIYIGTNFAGGDIRVTNTWNNNLAVASTLYYITNAEATWGGAKAEMHSTSGTPNQSITTTKANSLIICVNSDFSEKTTAVTYRDTPVQTVVDKDLAAEMRYYTWYKITTTTGAYTEGQTAPTAQATGFGMIEIRGP